jgi:hypothetical protein
VDNKKGFCTLCNRDISRCVCDKDTRELIALQVLRTSGVISECEYQKKATKIKIKLADRY